MTGGCPSDHDLARRFEGELVADQAAALDEHARSCLHCQAVLGELKALTAAIAAAPPLPEVDLVAAVRQRAALPPRRRSVARLSWSGAAAAGALAAALALAVAVRGGRSDRVAAPQARGAPTSPDAWVRLRAYRALPDGRTVELTPGGHLGRGDGVLIAYDNLDPAPWPFVMVVGADRAGRAFWYYPALSRDGDDGRSVPARAGAAVELPDEVRHTLAPGPLRLFALFSRAPLSVREVERALAAAAPTARRLPIADGAQHSIEVMVDAD